MGDRTIFKCPICNTQYVYSSTGNRAGDFFYNGNSITISNITKGTSFQCKGRVAGNRCPNIFEIQPSRSNKRIKIRLKDSKGRSLVTTLESVRTYRTLIDQSSSGINPYFDDDNDVYNVDITPHDSYKYSQRHKEMKKMKKLFKKYFKVLPREKRKDTKIASWYQSVVDTDDYMLLARSLNWLTKQLDDNGYGNGVTDDHSTFMIGLGMSASNNKIENAIELGLVKKETVANAMKGDKTAEKQVAQAMRTAEQLGFTKDSSRAKEYESLNDSQKKKFLESWDKSSLKSQKAKDKYEKDKKKFEDDEEVLYKQYEASNSRKTKWDDRTRKLKEKLGVDKLEGIIGEHVNSNEYSTKDNSYIYNGKDWDVWSNADKKRGYRELDEKDIENNPVREYYDVALKKANKRAGDFGNGYWEPSEKDLKKYGDRIKDDKYSKKSYEKKFDDKDLKEEQYRQAMLSAYDALLKE